MVDKSDARICWLKGPVGSGKSAISQTVAEWYADKNRLAARYALRSPLIEICLQFWSHSFFFLRGVGSRSAINRFIPSVTYQLSTSVPDTKPLIERVLHNEPSIFQSSFRHQLKKLLIEPILAVQNPILTRVAMAKPMIIVIDALDECDDRGSMAELIQSLVDVFQEKRRLPLRVFCTSRVEEHLRKKLESSAVHALDLQHFDAGVDIRKFLQSRFSAIHKENQTMRSIPLPWPSDTDLDGLVRKSEGSFVFADTLVNFIDDGTDFPHRKIQKALQANSGLDTLYSHVLSIAPRSGNVERVIGTIMLLNYLLPITSLAFLLRLETAEVLQALLGLQSILLIPADDNQPIRLFHTSLRDFLSAQSRSGIFFIDPPTRHFVIATDCLVSIAAQPENGVVYDGAQEYACLNWCDHFRRALTDDGGDSGLVSSPTGDSLMASITSFASRSLDFWVNTLIFKRNIPQMLGLLASVTSKLQVSQMFSSARRLLQVF